MNAFREGSCYLQAGSCESRHVPLYRARKGAASAFRLAVSFYWGGSYTSLGGSGDYVRFGKQGRAQFDFGQSYFPTPAHPS